MKKLRRYRPRRQKPGPGPILRPVLLLAAVTLAVRGLLYLGVGETAAAFLERVGGDDSVVAAVTRIGLGGEPDGRSLLDRAVTGQSILRASGTADEYELIHPEDLKEADDASPAPTAPARTPGPSGEPVPEEATRRSVDDDPGVRKVTIAPQTEKGYDVADGVYIKNSGDYALDVEKLLAEPADISLQGEGPHVLIVHTHTSEAYYPDGEDLYIPTDTERTEDTLYNVVRVGDRITELLEARGVRVRHIRESFDYPSYTGSYTRTLEAINRELEAFPSIGVIIDIHRDAITGSDGSLYRTVAEIDGKDAAQVMLVMGTDGGGLPHDDWRKNLALAVKVQKAMVDKYPLLARPINLREERFNQHATGGSMLIEMGTSANTLQEALYSAELVADALADVLLEYR